MRPHPPLLAHLNEKSPSCRGGLFSFAPFETIRLVPSFSSNRLSVLFSPVEDTRSFLGRQYQGVGPPPWFGALWVRPGRHLFVLREHANSNSALRLDTIHEISSSNDSLTWQNEKRTLQWQ